MIADKEITQPGETQTQPPHANRDVLINAIRTTILQLPAAEREAFILQHYLSATVSEVATHTQQTEMQVEALLNTANQRLYAGLRPFRHHTARQNGSGTTPTN